MKKKYYKGKNAIITGAASGIGREFAIRLAQLGTNLVLSDINMNRLEEVKKETETLGVRTVIMEVDVTKKAQVKNMAKTAIKEMGDIHFVFSNAGIAIGGPFDTLSIIQWKRIIDINLYGMIHVVRAFMPKLVEQGFGHIVVTASVAGTIGIGGLSPYNTTKFANAGFCESLYGEFAPKGISVSIICPFPLKTNLIETVGIGIPPDLLEGLEASCIDTGISAGKVHYWTEFTRKQSILKGFAGGFTVERSVERYLKKIRKKKLYIFERRYGRALQFLQGFWPGLYRKFLRSFGKRHINCVQETYDIALETAKKEQEKELPSHL